MLIHGKKLYQFTLSLQLTKFFQYSSKQIIYIILEEDGYGIKIIFEELFGGLIGFPTLISIFEKKGCRI